MSWTDVLSGAVGGLVGSAIPGWLAWLGLSSEGKKQREDRWRGEDAPLVEDAVGLLLDVDPDRRTASVTSVPAVEQATWDDILRRRAAVGAKLPAMAAGHPSASIRDCAQDLEGQVAASVVQTQWLVNDQLGHRDIPGQYDTARKCHEIATATAKSLQDRVRGGLEQPLALAKVSALRRRKAVRAEGDGPEVEMVCYRPVPAFWGLLQGDSTGAGAPAVGDPVSAAERLDPDDVVQEAFVQLLLHDDAEPICNPVRGCASSSATRSAKPPSSPG